MIDETLFEAEEKREKAVSVARDDLSSIRTGRANPGMFSRLTIDYYGSSTPITQLSSINVPEARLVEGRALVEAARVGGEALLDHERAVDATGLAAAEDLGDHLERLGVLR